MRVHHTERHLDGIETEVVRGGGRKHFEMDVGTLVACEPEETRLAGFLRGDERFHRAAGPEHVITVIHRADFVELEQVEMVGLEVVEGFVDLFLCAFAAATVDLGHQECAVAIAVSQRLAHAHFAFAGVIVPAVVEEVHAADRWPCGRCGWRPLRWGGRCEHRRDRRWKPSHPCDRVCGAGFRFSRPPASARPPVAVATAAETVTLRKSRRVMPGTSGGKGFGFAPAFEGPFDAGFDFYGKALPSS